MNTVSYSQYTLWANCPQAWKLKYVDGHRLDDGSIHTIFGTAMHNVIQDWLGILFSKSEVVAKSIVLDDALQVALYNEFKKLIRKKDGVKVFPCDRNELETFYHQGIQILSYIQEHRKKLFPTDNIKLLGVEFPIDVEVRPNVRYTGFVDIVTQDVTTEIITIYDLKTSKSGWSHYQKNDKVKISQLLLYKKFIADQFNVNLNSVKIQYLILKRIITENSMYHIPRVSTFEPANGKPSINKMWAEFESFLDECFNDTGHYKTDDIKHKASKNACRFCAFRDRKDLCEYGV